MTLCGQSEAHPIFQAMQPRTVGPKTQRLIEREATVPQCVYNMIKRSREDPSCPLLRTRIPSAFLLRANNGAVATHFDKWVSGNAFP